MRTPGSAPEGSGLRGAQVARLAWGATLLAAPGAVLTACRAPGDRRARTVLRVLGARHVVQALLAGRDPGRGAAAVGAAVDGAHALSAVALAILDPRRRRVAAADGGVATAWAVTGVWRALHSG
jgi:hypothetical protein